MRYILEIELLKGYEELAIGMYDQITKELYDRGIIKINKQEKIGIPYFESIKKLISLKGIKDDKPTSRK